MRLAQTARHQWRRLPPRDGELNQLPFLATPAALAFHLVVYLPDAAAQWIAENLKNALIINVLLAIFNLLPLPPLDGTTDRFW